MGRLIDEKDLIGLYDEDVKLWWGNVLEDIQDLPTVEAIPKAEYENRLKADMVAILTEIQLEIEEEKTNTEHLHYNELENAENYNNGVDTCSETIQQKINALKAESEGESMTREAIEALECMKKIKTLLAMDNEQHTRSIKLSELKEVCGL